MRIEHDIDSARIFVFGQDVPPGTSAIGRFKNSTFAIRAERMPQCGDEHNIRIRWMHDKRSNVPAILEADVFPISPPVDGFVDAVSKSDVAANGGFARANIDHIVIRLCDTDIPNG